MTDHREVVERLFARRDEYVAARKQRRRVLVSVGSVAACAALAAVVGATAHHIGQTPPVAAGDIASVAPGTTVPDTEPATSQATQTQTAKAPESYYPEQQPAGAPAVVYDTAQEKGDFCHFYVKKGTVEISPRFAEMGYPAGTTYCVCVDFSCCCSDAERNAYSYKGETVAELTDKIAALKKQGTVVGKIPVHDADGNEWEIDRIEYPKGVSEQITMAVEKLDNALNAYYEGKAVQFQDTFRRNGCTWLFRRDEFEPYAYTFATLEQLRAFTCKADEAFYFSPAPESVKTK